MLIYLHLDTRVFGGYLATFVVTGFGKQSGQPTRGGTEQEAFRSEALSNRVSNAATVTICRAALPCFPSRQQSIGTQLQVLRRRSCTVEGLSTEKQEHARPMPSCCCNGLVSEAFLACEPSFPVASRAGTYLADVDERWTVYASPMNPHSSIKHFNGTTLPFQTKTLAWT